MAAVELHQFRYSHYNEKVRWALDYKRIAHERIDYLPGPHMPQMQRLSGQRATPVLRIDGLVVSGSARIIEILEQRFPEQPLYPEQPELRQKALQIERRCDDELGPDSRRLVYDGMLVQPAYIAGMFSTGKPAWKRALYRAAIPAIAQGMRKGNGVTGESVSQASLTVTAFMDFIARETSATGYLAGDRFSVADLAAAALLTPVLDACHPDVAKPEPMPGRLRAIIDRFEAHPAAAWVHEQYRRHRGAS